VDPRKALVRDAYDAIALAWGEKRREGPTSERERKWVARFPIYYDAQTEAQSLDLLQASGFKIVDHHLQSISEARPWTGHLIILAEAA
jgi:hypothetical protein